jgi:hypothetical protein
MSTRKSIATLALRDRQPQTVTVTLDELRTSTAGAPRDDQQSADVFGRTLAPVPSDARPRGLGPNQGGAIVRQVAPGSPAAEGGVRSGDIILEVNRSRVASLDEAMSRLLGVAASAPAFVLALRDGQRIFLVLTRYRNGSAQKSPAGDGDGPADDSRQAKRGAKVPIIRRSSGTELGAIPGRPNRAVSHSPVWRFLVMTVTTIRPMHLAGAVVALAAAGFLIFRGPSAVDAAGAARGSNVLMNCEPTQQALVRQTMVDGEPQVMVNCVSTPLASGQAAYASPAAAQAYATPAVYTQTAPAPRVVQSAPVRRTSSAPARTSTDESKRSWKTTALVIGGSTGAGAGVGGAIGGKKGALIGAAIGGGSAAIFEAIKR